MVDEEKGYRYTGHIVFFLAMDARGAAEQLVIKLRREGYNAALGCLNHNVMEDGHSSGTAWFYVEHPESHELFQGLAAMGPGSYFRPPPSTNKTKPEKGEN